MRKTFIFLFVLMLFGLSSCDFKPNPRPEVPGGNVQEVYHTVTFVTNSTSVIDPIQVKENTLITKPSDPEKSGYKFIGWYMDEACTIAWNFDNKLHADVTLYAKYEKVTTYEDVYYSYRAEDYDAEVLKVDKTYNRFTINSGTEIRTRTKVWTNPDDSSESIEFTKSIKLGSSSNKVLVNVIGTGKLYVYVQNGSSGADYQKIKLTDPTGTPTEHEFVGNVASSPIVKMEFDVTDGVWEIARVSGTIDIFFMELVLTVEQTPEVGFGIEHTGITEYIQGQEFDGSQVRLYSIYESGITKALPLENVTIDSSAFVVGQHGEFNISISYKEYEDITYKVNVFAISDLVLGFNSQSKTTTTGFGNGVYYNQHVKQIYQIGEELDTAGLSVTVQAEHSGVVKEFLAKSGISYSTLDTSSVGEKEVVVTYTYAEGLSISSSYKVHVVATEPSLVNDVYQVMVDQEYNGELGAVVDGYNMFVTIQQALEFLGRSNVESAKQKHLVIAEGTYNEKVEIEIANLTITGAGVDKTLIEWDSLFGLEDEAGNVHTTDSTQTVAVRESAHHVIIEDLTISNFWNSIERFDQYLGAKYSEHRALALLVQADQFILRNASLLGYQDTVEFFTGRQYIENVLIKGTTDFIFGTNNTTYFTNCTIHSISNGDDDGGYITAFKGNNKGDNDYIVYGAIFDNCIFTADEDILGYGNTAIGRPWAKYASVTIMNSVLGSHISLKGSTGAARNERYVSMNALPTDETVKFYEYNNTGAGSLTEAVAGMKMLTTDEASSYADLSVVFGKTNGKVSWLDAWDPTSGEVAKDERTYYYFDGKTSDTGTYYTFDQTLTSIKGQEYAFGNMIINATSANAGYNANANALNMKSGAYMTLEVEANTEVIVNSYPGYQHYTINGVATVNDQSFSQYFEEATTVVIQSIGDAYIFSVIVCPNSEKPATPQLVDITVSGVETNYIVGTEVDMSTLVVKAQYSNGAVYTLDASQYTVNTSNVNINAEGSYDVTVTYMDLVAKITVNYEEPNSDPAITTPTVLSFESEDGYNAVVNNKRVTLEGSFRKNGAEYQIQGTISFLVKAGTIITVNPYANSQYASFTIGAKDEELQEMHVTTSYVAKEDCEIVYTGLSNNYLVSIEILPPVANQVYSFGNANTITADFNVTTESVGNIVLSGSARDNGDSVQLSQGTTISFAVNQFATIKVTGHSTGYGKLAIMLNNEIVNVEMNSNAVYEFTAQKAGLVVITALNVGTEESPAYNQSYIKAIEVSSITAITEDTTITFGSEGNYKTVEGLDISSASLRDNGGNNCQFSAGTMSMIVKAGSTVVINGYPGYTAYSINDGSTISGEITDTQYTYTAVADSMLTFTPTNSNNYFISIEIKAPKAPAEIVKEDVTITFGSEGSYKTPIDVIDLTNVQIGDNGGNNSQVKNGYITVTLYEGAVLTIAGYPGYTSYTLSDGTMTTEEITASDYSYTATADVVVTITPVSGNNYFYSMSITYPAPVVKEDVTITFGSEGNYKETVNVVDLSNIQISDNGGNNAQVKNGYITVTLYAGGTLTIAGYPGYTSYTVNDGTTTTEEITAADYSYTATEDVVLTITPVSGNNYFYSMSITY